MKQSILFFTVLIFLLPGCNEKPAMSNGIRIDIDRETKDVSIFDLFEKIEIIPLETTDESLIKEIYKIVYHNDNFYILDYGLGKIIVFDKDGKFRFTIDQRGQGPGEYLHIADFDVDRDSNRVLIVDPTGAKLLDYDADKGRFMKKTSLPELEGGAYNRIKYLNPKLIAFWTFDYKNRLKLYSRSSNRFINESFPEEESLYTRLGTPVFPYSSFITRPVDNNVYEITPEGDVSIAYSWDFGKLNIDPDKLFYPSEKELQQKFREYMEKARASEIVNYFFGASGGNETYLYTVIIRKNRGLHLFYNKETKEHLLFEKTKEQAYLYPCIWTEDFITGIIPNVDMILPLPDAILDAENLEKKRKRKEDDNPVLIKYYFKK
ncbi:MAG: 6-bladed beta-propeller [Prevotellaceae bacterium]|jgi:hypothetical protein|nr:6-bladed beta-propeller [Prevotellaceae bacterium]